MKDPKDNKNNMNIPPKKYDPSIELAMCIYGPPWMLNGEPGPKNQLGMMFQVNTWKCECGCENTGLFCSLCGKTKDGTDPRGDCAPPMPADAGDLAFATEADKWECKCGVLANGKFCRVCGAPRPSDENKAQPKLWICSCGHSNVGNFCEECGKAFSWYCPNCKQQREGKFCTDCGAKSPRA